MDFDLWWLLPIPAVFFALGWIAARIDIKHLLRESRALPLEPIAVRVNKRLEHRRKLSVGGVTESLHVQL